MKTVKMTIALLFLFVSGIVVAQSKSDKLFDMFRNKPGVTYFAFPKNMTDAFDIDLDDGKTITGDLNEIRFMSYNPKKGELSGSDFLRKTVGLLPGAYDKIVSVDDENDAEIWMLGNKRKASEFHVFVHNDSPENMQFVVSFYGDFDIDDVDGIREIGLNMSGEK